MSPLPRLGLLALAGVAGLATPASAQVSVRVPFVNVDVGPGVYVRAPFVRLYVPPRYAVGPIYPAPVLPAVRPLPAPAVLPGPHPLPRGLPSEPPPVPVEELRTVAAPPVRVSARAPTPREFAASFRPAPGAYEVVLEHPFTGRPVKVAFTLPEGAPRNVRVNRLKLEFDYGRYSVTVRFFRNGTVAVRS